MFCPKCGNELSLFADKCLSCGKSFMNMSLAERQKLEQLKPIIKPQRKSNRRHKKPVKKTQNKTTEVRVEYNNGYAVKEGMSITGTKRKRGAHRTFLFKY